MATRVTDGARLQSLFSSRAAALVLRVSRLRCSRARALLSLNLKKKRDCSRSRSKGNNKSRNIQFKENKLLNSVQA